MIFFVPMWDILILINITLLIILFGGYCILIVNYQKWFTHIKIFEPPAAGNPKIEFSIIIPARNEEENIETCVLSVLKNDYPKNLFEVIVADDFSDDNTAAIVSSLQQRYKNLRLVQLKDSVKEKINSYKKKSIETAISVSAKEWIITTDADCEVPAQWLQLFDAYIQQNNVVFIAAPVMFQNNGSLLSIFQCLDFISLQGITAASVSAGFHSMCNGANLAYKKDVFYEVKGFKDIDNIASGDDMLLMHKIKQRYPGQIGYLFNQNAIVKTLPMPDWKNFINQRIRWASKAASYEDKKIFGVLLLVYLFNLYLLVLPFLSIFYPFLFFYWLILLAGKILSEMPFIYAVAKFFRMKKLLWWFPVMQPFHIIYTITSGLLGKIGKYEWKGRSVK